MKRILVFLACLIGVALRAQYGTPVAPASQAQVNAGVVGFPYVVTPATLAGWTGASSPTNGVSRIEVQNLLTTSNYMASSDAFNLLTNNLPYATVSPLGFAATGRTNNGKMFGPDTPGTTTLGLQEAINSLPSIGSTNLPSGGTVILEAALYLIPHKLMDTNKAWLNIVGGGKVASGIVITSSIPQDLLRVDAYGTTNALSLGMYNMFVGSTTNACTNLITLNGPLNPSKAYVGNIAQATFDHVWFCWYPRVLALGWGPGNLNSDQAQDDGTPHNLNAIWYNNNYGAKADIVHCSFSFIGSVSLANDHWSLSDCEFMGCGTVLVSAGANGWPSSSFYSYGAQVVICDPYSADGSDQGNGNVSETFSDNHFVGGAPDILSVDDEAVYGNPHYFRNLYVEAAAPVVMTSLYSRMVNEDYRGGTASYCVITNTTVWNGPQMAIVPGQTNSNSATVVVENGASGLGEFIFNATNQANQFVGSYAGNGNLLTNLNLAASGGISLSSLGLIPGATNISALVVTNGTTNVISFDSGQLQQLASPAGTFSFTPGGVTIIGNENVSGDLSTSNVLSGTVIKANSYIEGDGGLLLFGDASSSLGLTLQTGGNLISQGSISASGGFISGSSTGFTGSVPYDLTGDYMHFIGGIMVSTNNTP